MPSNYSDCHTPYKLIEYFPKIYLCFFLLLFVGIFHPQAERIL